MQLAGRLRRSKTAIVLSFTAYDLRMWTAGLRTKAVTTGGSTHSRMVDVAASVDYIDRVFRDYLSYGGLDEADLAGKRVLELGPGDNFGVALRFIAAGAEQVVALDKFYSWRDPEQQRAIYTALLDSLPAGQRERAEGAISLAGDVEPDPERIRYVYGTGIEEGDKLFDHEAFDLIVSRAVLEHLYDTDASLDAMDRLLAPGGLMLHKVDFRDHGMFSGFGHNPLTFLTIPRRVWRWMSYHSGRPNRRLIDWYRRKLDALGYEDARLLTTHLVAQEAEVEPHRERVPREDWPRETGEVIEAVRPKLASDYRDLPDDDLAVQGIFMIARKPATQGAAPRATS